MTVQTINIGNQVNDGLGDDLRTAFQKVNANFASLGTLLTSMLTITATNIGSSGSSVFKQKTGSNLEFKKLVSGSKILLAETDTAIIINNTQDNAFVRFDTDAGSILANTHQQITLAGTAAPGSVTARKDIEVTTSGSTVMFKTIIPVTDILTSYDFGPITGQFSNAMQLVFAASNIDFGIIAVPGTLDLDCGTVV